MATPELYKVNVGSIITVTYAGLGLSSKLFRIETMDLQANGLIAVSAIEYIDIYTWEIPPVESVPPKSDPPTGFELVVPTGLAFTDSSGSNPRAFLAWTENTDYPVDEYRATVLDSGSKPVVNKIVNDNYVYLDLLAVGSYTATVTAINSVGSESNPSSALSFSVAQEPIYTGDVQDGAITNIKVNDIDATKITAGLINSDRINVDTLNVKYFANVSSKIYDHQSTAVAVPLLKYGSAIRGAGGTTIYTGSNDNFCNFSIS